MHEAISYLTRRLEGLSKETNEVFEELSKQVARETKLLEEMSYGKSFDEERVLLQERVVEALQDALEALEDAQDGAREAALVLKKVKP